jgi:hypothetical protein
MIDDPYLAKTILSFTSIYAAIETKVKDDVNMYFYNNRRYGFEITRMFYIM